MTEQELNEKLVKWVWPKARIKRDEFGSEFIPSGKPFRTHQIDAKPVPKYTRYLDDCFKDLVPKLKPKALIMETYEDGYEWSILSEKPSGGLWSATSGNAAVALCLAIEKLINAESK